ncbi:hypothetical protein IG631_19139 [Alternaria alternata]|nr:hypothetical protein IG631_19139 [Alternaria alternata]
MPGEVRSLFGSCPTWEVCPKQSHGIESWGDLFQNYCVWHHKNLHRGGIAGRSQLRSLIDAAAPCWVRTDGRPRGRTFGSSPRTSGPMTKEETQNEFCPEQ